MAVMKKSTRKKLSKQLNKLIKQHGAEMALALVTGIVGALASERANKPAKKSKSSKGEKAAKVAKPEKAPVKTVIIRKRS
jgi:glutamate-1-semialdehyde aminotransferase